MRRNKQQMLQDLQAKIAEEEKRTKAKETARAVASALAHHDYTAADSLALELSVLTAELRALAGDPVASIASASSASVAAVDHNNSLELPQ